MKVLVFSSSASNTGNWLRMQYLADSLRRYAEVRLARSLPQSLPYRLDLLLSLPLYFCRVLFSDADVYIGNKPHPNVTIPLLFAKYVKKKKIVIDIDDADFLYLQGLPARIIAFLQKPFPRFFDLVTYHNLRLNDFIGSEFGVPSDRLYRLEQGVDLERFRAQGSTVCKGTLFFMGSLDIASSLASILRAVSIVHERHRVALTVVGGGLLLPAFKKLAAELKIDVNFTGQLPVERTAEELARSDICLVYYDTMEANTYRSSMKLREYLAAGKKVVCNDVGELSDFKPYTYQSSSRIEDFARSIAAALAGGDGREARGPAFIRQHYDWAAIGKAFHARLTELLY